MSTSEYNDLFYKCQGTGEYHLYVFDIVGSKKMDNKKRLEAQKKSLMLMEKIYIALKELESINHKKVLVSNELNINGLGMKEEPFVFGDAFGFTVYRDSISKDMILNLFNIIKLELNINFEFHIADGYYETNDYGLGKRKYFRGYCIDFLSNKYKGGRR